MSNSNRDFSVIKRVSVFGGLAEEDVRRVTDRCRYVDVAAGQEIIRDGTPATEIFIVLTGKVKIVLDPENRAVTLAEFGPGECVGEASVIGIQDHSASVFTVEKSSFLILSRELLLDIFHNDQRLFSLIILNIARELARRLHKTDHILLRYGDATENGRPASAQKLRRGEME